MQEKLEKNEIFERMYCTVLDYWLKYIDVDINFNNESSNLVSYCLQSNKKSAILHTTEAIFPHKEWFNWVYCLGYVLEYWYILKPQRFCWSKKILNTSLSMFFEIHII